MDKQIQENERARGSALIDLLSFLLPTLEATLKENPLIHEVGVPPRNVEIRWFTSLDTVKSLHDEICTMRRGGTRTES